MSKTRVEIWIGGMANPTYTIHNPKSVVMCGGGVTVRIVDCEGWIFETSPHNVVMISTPEDKE